VLLLFELADLGKSQHAASRAQRLMMPRLFVFKCCLA
jgi:hypothetical protein